MFLLCTCTYCGYSFESYVYSKAGLNEKCCPKCKDYNLNFKDIEHESIDTYKVPIYSIDTYIECPPFPEDAKSLDEIATHEYGF